jgi:hypothetical protein
MHPESKKVVIRDLYCHALCTRLRSPESTRERVTLGEGRSVAFIRVRDTARFILELAEVIVLLFQSGLHGAHLLFQSGLLGARMLGFRLPNTLAQIFICRSPAASLNVRPQFGHVTF